MHWVPGRRAHVVVVHQYFIVFFPCTIKKIIHCTRECTLSVQELFFERCSLLVTLASKGITVKEKDKYIKKKYHSIQYLIYKFLFLLRWLCC